MEKLTNEQADWLDNQEVWDINENIIDDIICYIMHRWGPDRHVDGHNVITAFILRLLDYKKKD